MLTEQNEKTAEFWAPVDQQHLDGGTNSSLRQPIPQRKDDSDCSKGGVGCSNPAPERKRKGGHRRTKSESTAGTKQSTQ